MRIEPEPIPPEILALPKVELHAHLGGVAYPDLVRSMANKYGQDVSNIFDDNGNYIWSNFLEFVDVCDRACAVFKTASDYTELINDYLTRSAVNGLIYCELFVSPRYAEAMGLGYESCLEGLVDGIENAKRSHGIECRLVPIAERHYGPKEAERAVRLVLSNLCPEVVGFGMAGDEKRFDISDFGPSFELAREAGLGLTCHSGEFCGPEEVIATLEAIEVARIGHGVRSIEDPSVVRRLADEGVVLELCPGSNVALALFSNFESHPARRLWDAGVAITLNSDDPPFFKTDISREYYLANAKMGFTLGELCQITQTGINSAFCDLRTKEQLTQRLLDFCKEISTKTREHN
jgi:adenosine deaminase